MVFIKWHFRIERNQASTYPFYDHTFQLCKFLVKGKMKFLLLNYYLPYDIYANSLLLSNYFEIPKSPIFTILF